MHRTKFLDPDHHASHHSKTDFWCCRCGKDIRTRANARWVHLVDGGMQILHPEDEDSYIADGGDMGGHPLGPDCAHKIGLEWSRA